MKTTKQKIEVTNKVLNICNISNYILTAFCVGFFFFWIWSNSEMKEIWINLDVSCIALKVLLFGLEEFLNKRIEKLKLEVLKEDEFWKEK